MSDNQIHSRLSMQIPATYNIKVVGYLDDSWTRNFDMALDHATINDDMTITVLSGEVKDQAALFGLLDSLYGLGFPLLLVECKGWI